MFSHPLLTHAKKLTRKTKNLSRSVQQPILPFAENTF